MAERNCVTFLWKIYNLHGIEKFVESPEFYVNSLRESGWTLRLNIPSSSSEEVTVYLHNNFYASADALFCIDYEISILAADPQKSVTDTMRNIQVNPDTSYQILHYPTLFDVFQTSEFLLQEVLIVQCKLWKLNKSLPSSLYFHAFTSMGTRNTILKWSLDKFSSVEAGGKKKQRFFIGNDQPTFCIQTHVAKNKKEDIEILLQQTNKAFPKLSLTCQVSVLDGEGIIVRQKESSNVLSLGLKWKFPRFLKKRFLTSKRDDYLKNDQLVLLFEITYIANDEYSSIQSISNCSSTSKKRKKRKKRNASHKAYDMTSTLKDLQGDLYDLHALNSFSDIEIHGQGRSFPCHKCILSARSSVFRSLFTQSTREYTTDLDSSTLGTFLQFIYTGDLEKKLDFQTALKLYKAAGQYQIISLKQMCSDYLEENMTRENVCDVLLQASKLQDEELKRRAEDFILASPTDILGFSRWREIVKTSAVLIVDSVHRIFMVEMDQFNHSYNMPTFTTPISYDASKSSKKLKSDFLSIFQFPMFTDFRFVINSEYFSVHKNILWARSPVFKAMFSNKMKEIPANVLKIQDMDAQTIVRMLNFVYSGEIKEDLEYPQLSQLYYAAVKYQIFSLKDWCTTSLVRALSVKNVTNVLMLSDQHGDHELKKAVLDFVSENDKSIILSPEWKKLMTTDSKLASEALYEVYAKKLHGNQSSSKLESKVGEVASKDFFQSDQSFILEGELLCLYHEKFQSDFKLCTSKRSFEVHRNILLARSPVFKAMFLSNLKETTTNTLHVPDIDEQTLDQMLRYMYCGGIEYNERVDLCKLYYAADKYDINCLKDWCSYTLCKKISVDNVCDILVMADKHKDKALEEAAQNFLITKGKEVFNSDFWKDFMLIEPQVACQTMSTIYENKIFKRKLPK